MIDEKRFDALETRVGYLERDAEGEKRVSRYILQQTRLNSDDLALLIGRTGRVEGKVDQIEVKVDQIEVKVEQIEVKIDQIEGRLDRLETKFDAFPRIIAEVMREVLAEKKS